ncbi:GNAT family N-acetyltransferase [Saccharothrix sp. NPDC042600]|uniref:GNAT family N-acetyltransferase n=1 Tax=Saccharothrix TaxID=2071 RepID=UPI0033C393ED|nr:hypothetical protein GCM10017745_30430 [Saccharothrix mutabilis subsp. capreolus]
MTSTLTTATYVMRPGQEADRSDVAALIRARAAWMRAHDHGRWTSWDRNADELANQVGDPRWPTWVLCSDQHGIVGVTTASPTTPHLGWSDEEQGQPAIFLQSTATDPHHERRHLGVLIAFWALDYAAQVGKDWVRRGVLTIGNDNRGLVRYYQQQGWRVVRAGHHPRRQEVTVWSLQRPAELQPDMREVLHFDRPE